MKATLLINMGVGFLALFAMAATAQTSIGFTDIGILESCGVNSCCNPGCRLDIIDLAGCTGTADPIAGACYTQSMDVGVDLCSSAHVQAHFDRNPKTLDFINSAGSAYWCTLVCSQARYIGQCAYSDGGCTCNNITAGTT